MNYTLHAFMAEHGKLEDIYLHLVQYIIGKLKLN